MFEVPEIRRCLGPNCLAEILFVMNDCGKLMVLDREPHPAGSVRLDDRPGPGGRKVAHVMTTKELHDHNGERYAAHQQTCPDVEMFHR